MFEGTDLSSAYGSMYDAPTAQPAVAPLMSNPPPQPAIQKAAEVPKATASHAMPPEVSYAPPTAMYAQQGAGSAAGLRSQETFWDRLGQKKWEVMKLVIFGLVVLLGISMDRVANHYLNGYIGRAFLTDMQELIVRLSYPLSIILVLWIIKAWA